MVYVFPVPEYPNAIKFKFWPFSKQPKLGSTNSLKIASVSTFSPNILSTMNKWEQYQIVWTIEPTCNAFLHIMSIYTCTMHEKGTQFQKKYLFHTYCVRSLCINAFKFNIFNSILNTFQNRHAMKPIMLESFKLSQTKTAQISWIFCKLRSSSTSFKSI